MGKIKPLLQHVWLEDVADMVGVHQKCFQVAWTVESLYQLIETQKPLGLKVILGEKLVGFILVSAVVTEAEILTLGVDPDYQRQKLGQLLLNEMMALLQTKQVAKLFLEVAETNIAGIHFYQKNGFEKVGVRKNYYHFPNRTQADALIMQKLLST